MKLWKLCFLLVVLNLGKFDLMAQETFTNRLAKEKSPYLLQHATNPVDWYPWGEEAFGKARKENKPIFLSIGYSTCHWCHVMEEESFVNQEVAKVLNDHFVSIKVDREERPDIDHVFMKAVMAITGSGGWPMSLFLTPDLKPFYGGTYFPPEDRWGKPGFKTLLNAIHEKWKADSEHVIKSGNEIAAALKEDSDRKAVQTQTINEPILKLAYEQLQSRFDGAKGGFGDAPKFPQSHMLSFLLRYWKRTKDQQALTMVEKTLDEMRTGGMYDQLGGGFHRYSTDSDWRIPHFEKMLYDQAVISKTYLEAYQVTKKPEYAQTAREIFDYLLRDMVDTKGGFFSAEDADSIDPISGRKSEGAFYLWTYEEIFRALGKEKGEIFCYRYGILPEGNALEDPHGEFKRKNVLYLEHSLAETAEKFNQPLLKIEKVLNESEKAMFALRSSRVRPHLDDKVLTDWNGLMISSLAFGSRVLNEPKYGEAAQKAADFILSEMKDQNGRLMHRYRDGEVSIAGFLEDYAFFVHGLIDLYEATFDPKYIEEAKFLTREMIRLFWDKNEGGFYLTAQDTQELFSRPKEVYDGAVPSGNSVAVLSLLRLGRILMEREFEQHAQKTVDSFSSSIANYPSAFTQMLAAVDFAIGPSQEIVIVGDLKHPDTELILKIIYSRFLPNKITVFYPKSAAAAEKIERLLPFLKNQRSLDDRLTVYVCQNYVCKLPVTEPKKLEELLG